MFAGILLLVAGIINIIYGIAGISNDAFFNNTDYVFSGVERWGCITATLGIIQVAASFSLFAGRAFGRFVGIFAATLGAIGALLSIGGPHPFWSAGIFAICVVVVHGLVVYGEPERT